MTLNSSAAPEESLPVDLADREAELAAKTKSERISLYVLGTVLAILIAVSVGMSLTKAGVLPQIAGWTAVGLLLFITVGIAVGAAERNVELQRVRAKRLVYAQLKGTATRDEDYFKTLVNINVTNLSDYYYLVKTHTHASFRTSLGAGVLGFTLIVAGVAIGLAADEPMFGGIAAAAGIITEFIASVFFYLYNRTVRQLKEYHDSLLDVQDVLLALKVLEGLQDPVLKSDVVKSVVMYLMEGSRKLRSSALGLEVPARPGSKPHAG